MEINRSTDEVIVFLAKNRTIKQNLGKLAEECSEVLEVLLKNMTRRKGKEPSREKLVEELGDVIFRAAVVTEQMNMNEEINERVTLKAKEINNRINEGYFDKLKSDDGN